MNCIELKALQIAARTGTYAPDSGVPDVHLLDLARTIARHLVIIARDETAGIFDYDRLIQEIYALARASHDATREQLIKPVVDACALCPHIEALDVSLRKRSVLSRSRRRGVGFQPTLRLERVAFNSNQILRP